MEKEGFRPQPENQQQKSPEAGAGPLGISPPEPEQNPLGGDRQSPERQSLLQHGEGQGELADLDVSKESPETEPKDKSSIKHPRRRLAFPCPPISEMDRVDWRNNRRENPSSSTDPR